MDLHLRVLGLAAGVPGQFGVATAQHEVADRFGRGIEVLVVAASGREERPLFVGEYLEGDPNPRPDLGRTLEVISLAAQE